MSPLRDCLGRPTTHQLVQEAHACIAAASPAAVASFASRPTTPRVERGASPVGPHVQRLASAALPPPSLAPPGPAACEYTPPLVHVLCQRTPRHYVAPTYAVRTPVHRPAAPTAPSLSVSSSLSTGCSSARAASCMSTRPSPWRPRSRLRRCPRRNDGIRAYISLESSRMLLVCRLSCRIVSTEKR